VPAPGTTLLAELVISKLAVVWENCGARLVRCKVAYDCSSLCQKKDWNQGGHRLYCKLSKSAAVQPVHWNVLKALERRSY
jgi:hypothetical protein